MGSGTAILSEYASSPEDLKNALGVTKFTSETEYIHQIAGLIIQGGYKTGVGAGSTVTIDFNLAFPKQVLGVFCQAVTAGVDGWRVEAVALDSFDLVNGPTARDFYWWAIGV